MKIHDTKYLNQFWKVIKSLNIYYRHFEARDIQSNNDIYFYHTFNVILYCGKRYIGCIKYNERRSHLWIGLIQFYIYSFKGALLWQAHRYPDSVVIRDAIVSTFHNGQQNSIMIGVVHRAIKFTWFFFFKCREL